MNPKKVIEAINNAIEPFISGENKSFSLVENGSAHNFRLKIWNASSDARDDQGNYADNVKVVKWFSDFWLFIDLLFMDNTGENYLNPNALQITLSVFQGEESDPNKIQLFRAEWDDFDDGSLAHPQPHWHFMHTKVIENTVKEFTDYLPEHESFFSELLQEEKSKLIDLSKFHFAMQGEWSGNGFHIHKIENEKQLSAWFGGLLGYLKTELEFINSKKSYH